jgi:hypothetical protein
LKASFGGSIGFGWVRVGVSRGDGIFDFQGASRRGAVEVEVLDFAVVLAGNGFDRGGRDVAEATAEEFVFEEIVPAGEVGELMGDVIAEVGGDVERFFGDASGEEGFGFFGPGDEGGLGDAQAAGDGGEAQALDAETEELMVGGAGVHGEGMSCEL